MHRYKHICHRKRIPGLGRRCPNRFLSALLVIALLTTLMPFPSVALEASEDSLITGPITEAPIDGDRLVEPVLNWEYTIILISIWWELRIPANWNAMNRVVPQL